MNSAKIAMLRKLSPVILPLCLLVSVTGILRLGSAIRDNTTMHKILGPAQSSSAIFNTTEATFLQISQISKVMDNGDDETALELLHSLRDKPITTDGNTFHDANLKTFSPASFLMGMGNKLAVRAQSLKKSGQDALAYEYIQAIYSMGDNILASKTPSIKGLRLVHFFHGLASGTEGRFYAPHSLMATVSVSQHAALEKLWARQIIPQLSHRPDSEIASVDEQKKASRLFLEYRDEWVRIRQNDV